MLASAIERNKIKIRVTEKANLFQFEFSQRRFSRFAPTSAPPERKKTGDRSLGRSRGGYSSKFHLATDALGNVISFILTSGQRNDITQAKALIENPVPEYLLANKGYDSDKLFFC